MSISFKTRCLHILGQRCVVEILGHVFALGFRPFQELDQLLALGRILLLLIDEQPGGARDRVRVLARRIRHRETKVGRDVGSRECGRDGFQRRLDEITRRIFQIGIRHLVLQGVDQLDVADRIGSLFDLSGDAFVAFATEAGRPAHRGVVADLRFPFRADLAQVIGEDVGRAAAVGAMHHDDVCIGQVHAGIHRRDLRVVPFRDLAQVNVGDRSGRRASRSGCPAGCRS